MTPEEIRAIADPAQRIRAAEQAHGEALALARELAAVRRETVIEMKRTMSYGQIAHVLGVSRTRIQQLTQVVSPP